MARRNRQAGRNPRANIQQRERFKGKCKELKGHIYNVSRGAMKQGETFEKTTCRIAESIGRKSVKGGEFCTGMVKLKLPGLIELVPPRDLNKNKVGFEV